MMRRGLSLVALATVLASATPAHAFSCVLGCRGWCASPVPFSLGKASADLGEQASEAEVQKAFGAWAQLACTSLKVEYKGRTDQRAGNTNGVIDWIEMGWPTGSGVIGQTTSRLSGSCITSHMILNGVNYQWLAGAPAMRGQVNTFSIVAHEVGHYLGLGHSNAARALMAPSYGGGVLAITDDDQAGMCRIYPVGSAPGTDGGAPVDARADRSAPTDAVGAAPAAPAVDARAPSPSTPPPSSPPPQPPSQPPAMPASLADAAIGARDSAAPDAAGGAPDGAGCATNDDCRSRLCFEPPGGRPLCTRRCGADGDCAAGLACQPAGSAKLCLTGGTVAPQPGRSPVKGSACSIGAGGSSGAWTLLPLLMLAAARWRRRRPIVARCSRPRRRWRDRLVRGAPLVVLLAALSPAPARGQNACGDLLIVLDRSGSMRSCSIGGMSKEEIAKAALRKVIEQFPGVPMGLFVFPSDMAGGSCATGREAVPMARMAGPSILQFLMRMTSSGGTPTGSTLQAVKGYDKWTSGSYKHYVILLTDGQPTCDDGDDGAVPMNGMCVGGGPGIPCNGGGSCECRNPSKVFEAIDEMAKKGIHTFVIGFEGTASGNGCTTMRPFNPDTLNRAAELGLEPNRTGPTKYYSATDPASLEAALKQIVTTVARGGDPEFGPISPCDQGGELGPGGPSPGATDGGAPRNPLPTFGGPSGGSGAGGGSGGAPKIDAQGCSCALGGPGGGIGGITPAILLLAAVLVAAPRRRRAR